MSAPTGLSIAQEEANDYWAEREVKKWVVTLERGSKSKPEIEVKYVSARTSAGAISCAKENALRVQRPTRASCRLATAYDLGCTRSAA